MEQSNFLRELSLMEDSEIVLEGDETITSICTKWREWESKVKETQRFCPLPFSETEINYLDSRLLDELVSLEKPRRCPKKRTIRSHLYPLVASESELFKMFAQGALLVIQWVHRNFEVNFRIKDDMCFYLACRYGHLRIAKWYYATFENINLQPSSYRPICGATCSGNLDLVKWLYSLTTYEPSTMRSIAGHTVMCNGRVSILKWLASTEPTVITNLVFERAIHCRRFDICKWLVELFPHILNHANHIMVNICCNGTIEQVEWFTQTFPQVNPFNGRESPFERACVRGKLDIAQWLLKRYPIVLSNMNSLFNRVCWHNRLEVAKWLLEICPIDVGNNRAIISACSGNHLPVVEWLVKVTNEFNPERVDHAFALACIYGSLTLVLRMYRLFPNVNPTWNRNYAFRWACRHGNFVTVKWLYQTFPSIDIHAERNEAMLNASLHERTPIVRWLCTITHFPPSVYHTILRRIEEGQSDVLELLIDLGHIQLHDALDTLSRRGMHSLVDSLLKKYSQSKRRRIH